MTITQSDVQRMFNYLPDTGELVWKVDQGKNKTKGKKLQSISCSGYLRVVINKKGYLAHRLVYLLHAGYLPDIVDHVDRDKLNNRIENLRAANNLQNCRNSASRKNSTSRYLGVSKVKKYNKWVAQIMIKGKQTNLGWFTDEWEAALAYNTAAKEHFGEFANLNIEGSRD